MSPIPFGKVILFNGCTLNRSWLITRNSSKSRFLLIDTRGVKVTILHALVMDENMGKESGRDA